jgi:outer membrane protein
LALADPSDPTTPAKQNTQSNGQSGQKSGAGIVGKLPASLLADQDPAQKAYGLPRNPPAGGLVDTDLTKPLTLLQAVNLGLTFQNSIAISKTGVDQAAAKLTQAKSSYYPQIIPSYQYNVSLTPAKIYQFDPVTGLPIARLPNQSLSYTTQTSGITATQLIYDMGQREANVAQSRRSMFSAEYALGDSRQSVILQVSQDYYNLLRYRELIKEDEKSRDRYKETLDIITTQADVGAAAKSDIYQAKANLANAEVTLLQDQSNYRVAEATLKNAIGIVTSQRIILPTAVLPQPNPKPDPNALDQYVKLAYNNRLDVKQQQEVVYAQGYALRLAKIQAGLTIDATISEGYAVEPISGEERILNVSVSYPLFDGGNTRAAVRDNAALLEQQRRTLDQLEQTVRLAVEQSLEVREIARQRVVAAQVAVDAGTENLTVVRAKELNQLAGLVDVIAAETQLDAAGVSLVGAIYDYYVAGAALERSIGVNDPSYVPNVPGTKRATPAPPSPTP